jgi:hypothetical protein
VLLAVIAAPILTGGHLLEVAILLLAIGMLLLGDNVRELRSSIRPA